MKWYLQESTGGNECAEQVNVTSSNSRTSLPVPGVTVIDTCGASITKHTDSDDVRGVCLARWRNQVKQLKKAHEAMPFSCIVPVSITMTSHHKLCSLPYVLDLKFKGQGQGQICPFLFDL